MNLVSHKTNGRNNLRLKENVKGQSFADFALWMFFTLWLIVDTINGYFLNAGGSIPLSQCMKLLVLIIIIFRIACIYRNLILIFTTIGYLIILFIGLTINDRDVVDSIVLSSKLITTVYLFLYFCYSIKLYQHTYFKKVKNVIIVGVCVLCLNITLGLFKIGYHTYDLLEIGYKGYFYAGNELGGVIGATFPFILYVVFWNSSNFTYCMISIYLLMVAILLSTKAAIILSIFWIFAIPWIFGSAKLKKNIRIFAIVFIGFLTFYFIKFYNIEKDSLIFKYLMTFDEGGIEDLAFSGRTGFVKNRFATFLDGNLWEKLFGLGGNQTVEMDWGDMILNFGYFGFILMIGLFGYILYFSYKRRHNNSFGKVLVIQNLLLILLSLSAGHILFSSMAGLYIAMTNSLVMIKYNPNRCIIRI